MWPKFEKEFTLRHTNPPSALSLTPILRSQLPTTAPSQPTTPHNHRHRVASKPADSLPSFQSHSKPILSHPLSHHLSTPSKKISTMSKDDVEMADAPPAADTASEDKKKSPSRPTTAPRFEIKKWNAVREK